MILLKKTLFQRARKEEKSNAEKERKAREIEDAKWKDDDKQLQKKQVLLTLNMNKVLLNICLI